MLIESAGAGRWLYELIHAWGLLFALCYSGAHNVYYVKCTRTIKRHVKAAGFVHVKKLLAHKLPGKLADKLVSMDKAGASNEELAQTMGGLRGLRIGMLEGNTDEGYIALGTGIGNIRSIKSVAEVVNELAIC